MIKLMDYQIDFVQKWVFEQQRVLLQADTGSGKTIMALAGMCVYNEYVKPLKNVLFVVPNNAIAQFEKESKLFNPEFNMEFITPDRFTNGKAERSDIRVGSEHTRHKVMGLDGNETSWKSVKSINKGSYFDYDMIIIDEAHLFKATSSNRGKALRKLGKLAPDIPMLFMTATPKDKTSDQLYNYFEAIKPGIFGPQYDFKKKYLIVRNNRIISDNKKASEELASKIAPYMHIIPTSITDKVMPDVNDDIIHEVDLPADMKFYQWELAQELKAIYADRPRNMMHELINFTQLTGGLYAHPAREPVEVHSPKYDKLDELVAELPKPLLIFTNFNCEIDNIVKRYEKDLTTEVISGKISSGKRVEIKDKFNAREIDLLVVNQRAGNAGMDLTAGEHAIFFSTNISSIVDKQSRGRIRRRSSETDTVQYHTILIKDSVEEAAYKKLTGKIKSNVNMNKYLMNLLRTKEW